MPLFYYSSLNLSGKKKLGMIEAPSLKEAKEKLIVSGVLITRLSDQPLNWRPWRRTDLKGTKLITFTEQLAKLLKGGIPLFEALLSLEEQFKTSSEHPLLLHLVRQLREGSSFGEALSAFPKSFNVLYRSLVEAGESTGTLPTMLEKLTLLLKKERDLKKKLLLALSYPLLLAGFSLAILTVLLSFVVPSIGMIFEGRTVNGFTQFVFGLSTVVRKGWWAGLGAMILLGCLALFLYRRDEMKIRIEKLLFRIPLVGSLRIQSAMTRFTSTLGALLRGDIPLVEALQTAIPTMRNPVLEDAVEKARLQLLEGSSLGKELGRISYFPPLATRMIEAGENSGQLAPMLESIGELYQEEVSRKTSQLLTLLQPVILIIMGLIVGLVMLAVLLPLTDVGGWIQ